MDCPCLWYGVWYNRGMKRHLIISQGTDPSSKLCAVRVVEDDQTLHFNPRVRYGVAIVGIMEEWDAYTLRYTLAARAKFLGKTLDPTLLT